jgi:hypothetical protein
MDGTAIATLILAFVTAILAFFNWRIIRENRKLWQEERKERLLKETKERKERLLKEIIDWGESIIKSCFVSNLEELIIVLKLTGTDKRHVLSLKYETESKIARIRYTYLKSAASELDVSIQNAINDVLANLNGHIYILGLEFDGKTKEKDVEDSINRLTKSVNKMIEITVSFLPK